jgi:hypothetical protein
MFQHPYPESNAIILARPILKSRYAREHIPGQDKSFFYRGFSLNTAKDFSLSCVKTHKVQPGKSGANGLETFTDSAALSTDCRESSSTA